MPGGRTWRAGELAREKLTRRPASVAAEAQASPASSKEMRRPASVVMEAWASIATRRPASGVGGSSKLDDEEVGEHCAERGKR